MGLGYAESESPLLFADPGAEARALDDAEGKAWADAVSSVELAPCPACGRRDGDKWRQWVRARLVPGLAWGLLGGGLGVIGLFLLRQEVDRWPLVAGAIAFVLVSGSSLALQIARKRARSSAVAVRPRTGH